MSQIPRSGVERASSQPDKVGIRAVEPWLLGAVAFYQWPDSNIGPHLQPVAFLVGRKRTTAAETFAKAADPRSFAYTVV